MPDGRSFLLLTLELLRAAAAVRQTRRLVTIDFRISLTLATAAVHKAAAFEAAHTTRSGQSIPSELSLYESKLIIIWAVGTPALSLPFWVDSRTEQVRAEGGPPERSGSYTPSPSHVARCWIPVLGKSTGIQQRAEWSPAAQVRFIQPFTLATVARRSRLT